MQLQAHHDHADAFLGAAPLYGEAGGAAAMAALGVRSEDQDGIVGGAAVVGERGERITVTGLWGAPAAKSFAGQFAARLALQERLGFDPGGVALDDGTARFGIVLLGAGDCPGVAPRAGPADVDLDATAIGVTVQNEVSVRAWVRCRGSEVHAAGQSSPGPCPVMRVPRSIPAAGTARARRGAVARLRRCSAATGRRNGHRSNLPANHRTR